MIHIAKEIKFKGTITRIIDGSQWDAVSYMVVDNKEVVFNYGRCKEVIGSLIGFDKREPGWEKKCIGKSVEVFGVEDEENTKRISYTIIGNSKYYIKIV